MLAKCPRNLKTKRRKQDPQTGHFLGHLVYSRLFATKPTKGFGTCVLGSMVR